MTIKAIVELPAKPGKRGELLELIKKIAAEHGPHMKDYRGGAFFEVPENPDMLVEIAEWDSVEERDSVMQEAMKANLLAPVMELLAGPIRATVAKPLA